MPNLTSLHSLASSTTLLHAQQREMILASYIRRSMALNWLLWMVCVCVCVYARARAVREGGEDFCVCTCVHMCMFVRVIML